jgi:N-acetylglutamate synthase-like GNAT family acetyltransferase
MKAEPITASDARWPAFERALAESGLPTDDLADAGQQFFAFGSGAAFGGFAVANGAALLRSLVVERARRGGGLGGEALRALVAQARRAGAGEAWLLTADAAPFFARQGFAPAAREIAPRVVASSRQFTALCPASASLMCKKPI